jgi:hypothetical protein
MDMVLHNENERLCWVVGFNFEVELIEGRSGPG